MSRVPAPALVVMSLLLLVAAVPVDGRLVDFRADRDMVLQDPFATVQPDTFAFTALVGGLRPYLVNLLWVRAQELELAGDYDESEFLARWIAGLQPHFPEVWSFNAWNMAYNISRSYVDPDPEAERRERWRWVRDGIAYLETGLDKNPEHPVLLEELGLIWAHRAMFDDVEALARRDLGHGPLVEADRTLARAWRDADGDVRPNARHTALLLRTFVVRALALEHARRGTVEDLETAAVLTERQIALSVEYNSMQERRTARIGGHKAERQLETLRTVPAALRLEARARRLFAAAGRARDPAERERLGFEFVRALTEADDAWGAIVNRPVEEQPAQVWRNAMAFQRRVRAARLEHTAAALGDREDLLPVLEEQLAMVRGWLEIWMREINDGPLSVSPMMMVPEPEVRDLRNLEQALDLRLEGVRLRASGREAEGRERLERSLEILDGLRRGPGRLRFPLTGDRAASRLRAALDAPDGR